MSVVASHHEFRGRMASIRELAALAGCTYIAMYCRLRLGHSAEHAVSMGAPTRARKTPPSKGWQGPKPQSKPSGPVLAADAPVVATTAQVATVRRTMPVDPRYGVTEAPSVFSKLGPGQYLDSDTHLARVYGSRG